jgi:hypothetical protein
MEYRKKKRRCKISEEPEIESTNSPLMKSLVNLMVGISKEKLVLPLEETVIFFLCVSQRNLKQETIDKATCSSWDL